MSPGSFATPGQGPGFIDVNVSLGHWPLQWFDQRTGAELDAHLAAEGIEEAWVSSIDAILYPDVDACDEKLAVQLERFPRLRQVKTINPLLGNFRESFESFGGHAIKLFPNYHQYELSDPRVHELMAAAAQRQTLVMVQIRVDDERNQYPLMKVPGVPVSQVADLARKFPQVNFVALCSHMPEWSQLRPAENVFVELSFVERFRTLTTALQFLPASRILFGSHTPVLYTRSAVLKWQLADVDSTTRRQIACENARRLETAPAIARP